MTGPAQEFIERLKGPGTPFAMVEGAAAFSAVDKRPDATPAAFVFVRSEASGDNERIDTVLQRIETDVAVVIVADNPTDRYMGAAAADIDTLKDWVRGRLVGHIIDCEAVEHVSGELVAASGGVVWYEDVYSIAGYLEG